MRAVLGVVSLLIVVALVGLLARRQLHTVQAVQAPAQGEAPGTAAPNVREQSQQIQRKVADDIANAMNQATERAAQGLQETSPAFLSAASQPPQ